MAVYFAPQPKYNFWTNLSNAGVGLVTDLLGQQLGAMIDRANKAKQVEAARRVMAGAQDVSGMNALQARQAYMNNPEFFKLNKDAQNAMLVNADLAGQYSADDTFRRGWLGNGGTEAQADIMTGGLRAGFNPANFSQIIERATPELKRQFVDLGGQVQGVEYNPFKSGMVTALTSNKTASPGELLQKETAQAEMALKKYIADANIAEQRRAHNLSYAAARSRPHGGGSAELFQLPNGSYQYIGRDGRPLSAPINGVPARYNRGSKGNNKELSWEDRNGMYESLRGLYQDNPEALKLIDEYWGKSLANELFPTQAMGTAYDPEVTYMALMGYEDNPKNREKARKEMKAMQEKYNK